MESSGCPSSGLTSVPQKSRAYRSPMPPQASEPKDPLAGEPFSFSTRANGEIQIRYHGTPVTILRGLAAERFTERIDGSDAAAAQQLMARATGNFKRGNERRSKRAD
jgi:hypothetical protein